MKILGIFIAVFSVFSINNAQAGSALICEASGKIDGITSIHAEDSNPAPEACVEINGKDVHCAKGSIMDLQIEVSSTTQTGIGTIQVLIEKVELPTQTAYILKKVFNCDWVNGEEHCGMNSPEVELQREMMNCNLIRE